MASVVKLRAVTCPNCGGSVQLRGFAHTLVVTCGQCGTVLDTSSGAPAVLAQAQKQQTIQPLIPMGSRGKFDGETYEAIGFQTRSIFSYGQRYSWDEYVLFHPYKGFRYLTEYQGHWNLARPAESLPEDMGTRFPGKQYRGRRYRPFQKAEATTDYVIGEFPWRVSLGENVTAFDYISQPYMLSSESTSGETTWSVGLYTPGREIWKAFGLPDGPPKARGVYANQVNPWGPKVASYTKLGGIGCALALVILLFFVFTKPSTPVYSSQASFDPTVAAEQSLVSPVFEIKESHGTAVRVDTNANVDQNWIFLAIALVNKDTNESFDVAQTLSHYSGVDDGESWSQGSRQGDETIYRVPAGRYYLRIDPARDRETGESLADADRTIGYDVSVKQGEPSYLLFFLVILLLAVPMFFTWWRYYAFETERWRESEFESSGTSKPSDSGDDD